MLNLSWERNKDNVLLTLSTYFGLTNEQILKLIDKKYQPSGSIHIDYVNRNRDDDREKLVAVVAALSPACKKGLPAYVDGVPQKNIAERRKSAEAILSNPSFSDETPVDIYYRLKRLYNSISEKGIDIYKTIYVTSLTDGNYGIIHDRNTGAVVSNYSDFDKDFDRIYDELKTVLRLSQEKANAVVEKCSATILSKVSASNIPAIYEQIMKFYMEENPEHNYWFFNKDKEFEKMKREDSKSKMVDDGLINCPTLFSCKPKTVRLAFDYVVSKITDDAVEREYERFKSAQNTTMTRFWCKFHIMRNWVNNNFSLLTINAGCMEYKESTLENIANSLNERVYYGGKATNYGFSFLFHEPVSISTMNSIPIEKIERYATHNILVLEMYTDEAGVMNYINANPYVLAMETKKLQTLLKTIKTHDEENPENPYMARFFALGKSLFGNKHCINFDVIPTFQNLEKVDNIEILDVEQMTDWQRVEKFVEIFCNNDEKIIPQIKNLLYKKREKEKLGDGELRKEIRSILAKSGGWDAIFKDRRALWSITSQIEGFQNRRYAVEQIRVTDNDVEDFKRLQESENQFADEIKSVLAVFRDSYAEKKNKMGKRFTDIDKLYEMTLEFLTEKCFDDKEPISVLLESELRAPLMESLKNFDGAYIDPQPTFFGGDRVVVPVSEQLYRPMKDLTEKISKDASTDAKADRIEIVKSKG